MNINEMDLDQASDAMLRISNVIGFVLEDKEVTDLLDEIGQSDSESIMAWIPKYLPKIAQIVLRKHRDSMYEIISALSGESKQQVGKMNFGQVVALLRENWETLTGFFPSAEA